VPVSGFEIVAAGGAVEMGEVATGAGIAGVFTGVGGGVGAGLD